MTEIIVSTTSRLEGLPAKEYLGIVTGEVIVGAHLFRGLFASVRDIVGRRAAASGTAILVRVARKRPER